jgi:3-(3-hydroxy-phenyl)propionate hydroxylase
MHRAGMFDVAIVGLGPVGAVAAALLGQNGVRVIACDRSLEVHAYPRALAIDDEVMRVFQQLGIVGAIAAHVEPFERFEYYADDGRLIRSLSLLTSFSPQGYTPSLVISQPHIERALRELLSKLPSVILRLGCELLHLDTSEAGAQLELTTADGQRERVRARWVIACDGANSRVRELLDIGAHDLCVDEPKLVVDVDVRKTALGKLPTVSAQYREFRRPYSYYVGTRNHRRWEISLFSGEEQTCKARPDHVWQLLSPWLAREDGELLQATCHRFNSLIAKRWQHMSVFLAGDAAHTQLPFLGQGLCQGVRDVVNLCWKLSAVLRAEPAGRAAKNLLVSYTSERSLHVCKLIQRIKALDDAPRECNAKAPSAVVRPRARKYDISSFYLLRHELQPPLDAGFLDVVPSSARGTLFPQPRLTLIAGDSVPMDMQFGYGWRLVMDETMAPPSSRAGLLVIPFGKNGFHDREGVVASWMRQYECHAALLRPDHYVYGVASRPEKLARLIAHWHVEMRG